MQAAIGTAQLKKLPGFIKARKKNFDFLYRRLKKYEKYFILPHVMDDSQPSWFGFPLLVKGGLSFERADIVNYLEDSMISTRMLFGGNLTKQPAYKNIKYRVAGSLENTDLVMNNLFWLGVYPGLSEAQLLYIISVFDDFIASKGGK